MANRVEITEDVDIWIARGLMSFKKGWKGPVKAEVHQKLMDRKAARDTSSKAEEKTAPKSETEAPEVSETDQSDDDTKEKKRGLWPSS